MPITFNCPSCQASLTLSDAAAGRRGKCPHCKAELVVPSPGVTAAPPPFTAAPPPPPPPPPLPEMGYDEPALSAGPSGNGQPHRGPLVLTLGIIGDVLLLSAPFALCCPFVFWLPLLVGLGLCVTALLLGRTDLARIQAGEMDPAGRGMTMGGFICGVVGTVLHAILLLLTIAWLLFVMFSSSGSNRTNRFTGFQPVPATFRAID
jgi:hypothetical protein